MDDGEQAWVRQGRRCRSGCPTGLLLLQLLLFRPHEDPLGGPDVPLLPLGLVFSAFVFQ